MAKYVVPGSLKLPNAGLVSLAISSGKNIYVYGKVQFLNDFRDRVQILKNIKDNNKKKKKQLQKCK